MSLGIWKWARNVEILMSTEGFKDEVLINQAESLSWSVCSNQTLYWSNGNINDVADKVEM